MIPVLIFATVASLAAEPLDELLEELTGQAAAVERSPERWQAAFAQALAALLPDMASERLLEREQAQQTWQTICFRAGQPEAETPRAAVCRAMTAQLGPDTPQPTRVWLLRQLARLGHPDETAVPVAALLLDEDLEVRDCARRVLQNLPGDVPQLRAALREAQTAAARVAFINALGARRDWVAVPDLSTLAAAAEPAVASAALAALADIGGRDALEALVARVRAPGPPNEAAVVALLRAAQTLVEVGHAERAARLYAELHALPLPEHLHTAALCGWAAADMAGALPALRAAITNESSTDLRLVAARLLADALLPEATEAVATLLPGLPADAQVVSLDALAARGERGAKPAVLALLECEDAAVRGAVVAALAELGDATDVQTLARLAGEAGVKDAARRALARLRGDNVDAALIAGLADAPPGGSAELIRALGARHCRAAVEPLRAQTQHAVEEVRMAAFEALGQLCHPDEAALLMAQLPTTADATRTAAEDAIAAVCLRNEAEAEQAAPVLAVWDQAAPADRVSLVRVLGRVGGPAALERIRASVQAPDEDLADAAVRALASWSTAEPLDDVLAIARQSSSKAHRVLALQGFLRMLGLPHEREPQANFELYKTAMSLAERPEERKAVLGGLGKAACPDALEFAQQYLDDAELKAEAESATVTVAFYVAAFDAAAARTAAERVLAQTDNAAARQTAERVFKQVRTAQSAVMTWVYCGPYFEDGLDALGAYHAAFAPESPGREQLEWKPLKVTNDREPWVFDLTAIDKGENRCVYLHAAIWSEREQPAHLAVGSDDMVKVWLNGALVHEFKEVRGHEPLHDKVPVTLHAGWNPLLLKVVQCAGGWGVSGGVLTAEGDALPGLKFEARPP